MKKSLNCPLCGSKVIHKSEEIAGIFKIETVCGCGLSFVTRHINCVSEQDYRNAWDIHYRKWNTRKSINDLIDIKVYAENIISRIDNHIKENYHDGMAE